MPLERFDLVIEAFHETAAETVDEVIGYLVQPIIERCQERVKTGE